MVFQFTLSVALIACTAIMFRQMNYIQTRNLGLDRGNIIYVPLEGTLNAKYEVFKQQLMQKGTVQHITRTSSLPTNVNGVTDAVRWPGKAADDKTSLWQVEAQYDFIKTMKIPLVAGRDFSLHLAPIRPTFSSMKPPLR